MRSGIARGHGFIDLEQASCGELRKDAGERPERLLLCALVVGLREVGELVGCSDRPVAVSAGPDGCVTILM